MVIHILKDGSVLKDITGHVVQVEDATSLYSLIKNMNNGSKTVRKTKGELKVC